MVEYDGDRFIDKTLKQSLLWRLTNARAFQFDGPARIPFFGGAAVALDLIDIREFKGDIEAHDSTLQKRYLDEMSANFNAAVAQASALWGKPVVRIRRGDDAKLWVNRLHIGFIEMAAWPREDGKLVFVLYDHEDRELPIVLLAGVAA